MQIDGPHIRQKGNRSRPFNFVSEGSLVLCTTAGQSSGNDFTALGYKISQRFGVLVVYFETGIRTKPAHLAPMKYSSLFPLELLSSWVSCRSCHFYASSSAADVVCSAAASSVSEEGAPEGAPSSVWASCCSGTGSFTGFSG